ncbi:Ig-like domain-containing protein [Variovorax paradoxus]|uniref:Ig-like domain-containing protein n=1 Tax=Variovorax paradoxus TaxID=34073 RepID=UPI002788D074|nr:Ig-like domain-containing protein [Variovorax paradoxus]MDQ0586202.1 CshA-type fibril repeat protein [Variovorax paradoxus]
MKKDPWAIGTVAVAVATVVVACGGGGSNGAGFAAGGLPAGAGTPVAGTGNPTGGTGGSPTGTAPVATNDSASGQAGASVTVGVLDNDQDADGNLDRNSVRFVQPPAGATLSGDGRSLQVPNEGSWQVGSDGAVVFTPASGFTGSPTVVSYTVSDTTGLTSSAATITITVAVASATSSAACFNEGFFRTGTTMDLEHTVSGDGATPPRRTVRTVTGPKEFNGAATIETKSDFYGDDGSFATTTMDYNAIQDGFMLFYGMTSSNVRQISVPPKKQPIAMEPGQTFDFTYTTKNEYADRVEEATTTTSYTYVGRETLQSAVGTFAACKFTSHGVNTVVTPAPMTQTFDLVIWVAAEGPYRGFALRTEAVGQYPNAPTTRQVVQPTKISVFDIK